MPGNERIFIDTIACSLGSTIIDNSSQGLEFGKDQDFLRRRVGTLSLPQRSPDESACSLALQATRTALSQSKADISDIDLLIFVSQNPDCGGLPHNSALLHGLLKLKNTCACFDIGLGCSGYIYGLAVAASLMTTGAFNTALLITSDQYRASLNPNDAGTRLLFGDGASATILSKKGAWEFRGVRLGTDGSQSASLMRTPSGIAMDGRAVYNFARSVMPKEIRTFCAEHKFGLETVDQVLAHQGSRAIVEDIASKLDLTMDQCPVEIEGIGNTVSSSIPFLLRHRLIDNALNRMLLCGFGVGLSWGIAWLERTRS